MPRDAVSRTANVERTGRHEWIKGGNEVKADNEFICVNEVTNKAI